MSDLFHNDIPIFFICQVFDVMERPHWHRFQVLTKRAERLSELAPLLNWSENIWVGVTAENILCSKRIDYLCNIPAVVRFLFLEPLLGPLPDMDLSRIDWVIVGGESGPGARPVSKKCMLDIHEQCRKANVPFFFKQGGGVNKKKVGRFLNGRVYCEMPGKADFIFEKKKFHCN